MKRIEPSDNANYCIVYEDQDRPNEFIVGTNVAATRYEMISDNWNAHLFGKMDTNCKQDDNEFGRDNVFTTEDILELEFLQYFYEQAGDAFGPADSEIYGCIQEEYTGQLPQSYIEEDDDN